MSLNEGGDAPAEDQIVWINQKLVQLREQRNKARENVYQLDMDLHQAHRTIHGLSKNIDKIQENISQLNRQLRTSQVEIKEQAAKIEELEDIIARQKRTIKIQSDKISETREVIPRRPGHDHRAAIFDWPPPVYNQSPSAFNQPNPVHSQPGTTYNHSHPVYNQPGTATNQPQPLYNQFQPPAGLLHPGPSNGSPQKPHPNNNQPSPFRPPSRQVHTRPANIFSTPSRGVGTPSPYSPHRSTPSSAVTPGTMEVYRSPHFSAIRSAPYNNSSASQETWMEGMAPYPAGGVMLEDMGALTIQDEEGIDGIPWPAEFGQFFKLTEEWARNYTNVPNEYQDRHLPDDLFASMKRQASEDMVMNFLGSGATRYFLIARLMNTWITNDIFRAQCFLHYSPDFDQKFHQSRQIPQNDPIHTRAGLLMAVADSAKQMQARPNFQNFLSSLVTMKVDGMWARLLPLLAPGVLQPQAFDDMVHLIGEAIRMGLLMIATPLAYSIEFPKASHATYFRPDAMINRDPELQGDPQQLRHEGAVVRLGVTPVVVVTSFAGPSINPRTVHFANVLLQREPSRPR